MPSRTRCVPRCAIAATRWHELTRLSEFVLDICPRAGVRRTGRSRAARRAAPGRTIHPSPTGTHAAVARSDHDWGSSLGGASGLDRHARVSARTRRRGRRGRRERRAAFDAQVAAAAEQRAAEIAELEARGVVEDGRRRDIGRRGAVLGIRLGPIGRYRRRPIRAHVGSVGCDDAACSRLPTSRRALDVGRDCTAAPRVPVRPNHRAPRGTRGSRSTELPVLSGQDHRGRAETVRSRDRSNGPASRGTWDVASDSTACLPRERAS